MTVEAGIPQLHITVKQPKDIFDTTASYATEKWASMAKLLYVAIDVLNEFKAIPGEYVPVFASIRNTANIVKLSRFLPDLFDNLNKVRYRFREYREKDWSEGNRVGGMGGVLRKLNNCVSPLWDLVDLNTKAITHLPKTSAFVQGAKGIMGISLSIGMGLNTVDDIVGIADTQMHKITSRYPEKEQELKFQKINTHVLSLISSVSYVALGVLTVLSVYFAFVFASPVWTALSAATVFPSVTKYYYEQWWLQGKDLKKEIEQLNRYPVKIVPKLSIVNN